jgi:predicted flap endonuclease-1-like 5' DNA nuclease
MKIKYLLIALAIVTPAAASEYPLDQAKAIIPHPEATRLRKAGIRTTLDILTSGLSPDKRRQLAARSGLPPERIEALAALADLLRVRGIGPDVARLLTAAGVRTIADLQRCDPTAVAAAIKDLNRERKLSTNPPGAESISYWITQARLLPIVLQ